MLCKQTYLGINSFLNFVFRLDYVEEKKTERIETKIKIKEEVSIDHLEVFLSFIDSSLFCLEF